MENITFQRATHRNKTFNHYTDDGSWGYWSVRAHTYAIVVIVRRGNVFLSYSEIRTRDVGTVNAHSSVLRRHGNCFIVLAKYSIDMITDKTDVWCRRRRGVFHINQPNPRKGKKRYIA